MRIRYPANEIILLEVYMDQTEGSATPAMRHKARHFALQAIYQWQLTGMPGHTIEEQFLEDQPVQGADL